MPMSVSWKGGLLSLLMICDRQHNIPCCDAFSFGQSHKYQICSRLHMSSTSTPFEKLTVPELKLQLKERRLSVSGNKAALVQRLTEYEEVSSSSGHNNDTPHDNMVEADMNEKPTSSNNAKNTGQSKKDVSDAIRMLEGLKLGPSSKMSDTPSLNEFSGLPKRQKEMMQSLKESLQSAHNNGDEEEDNVEEMQKDRSPEQQARLELLEHYKQQFRMRPANDLKEELTSLRLTNRGRKPDLVARLAEFYVTQELGEGGVVEQHDNPLHPTEQLPLRLSVTSKDDDTVVSFAGIPRLSIAASNALTQAFGDGSGTPPEPTPIQAVAISKLFYPPQPSAILHAPTGSGKTLTYLLPITESLWREVNENQVDSNEIENGIALVLLPTRELAAQVAGVATVLAPPGMVRLVSQPMDLMRKGKIDAGADFAYYEEHGKGDLDKVTGPTYSPRILVGSAKSISISLFGDGKMPGSPTRKPDGKRLLSSVRWLVMDEVDRLLNIKKSRTDRPNKHEKPAAILAASIARLTFGRTQVIAASATVGRPLRRELSRVLGLPSSECPETLRGEDDSNRLEARLQSSGDDKHIGRAVRIPSTVNNYVLPVDGSTAGTLLTSAAFATKAMMGSTEELESSKKVLVVLTRNCDIKVHNALGALKHFGIRPEPQSLLDALEADGNDRLMEVHRRVSGVVGVGGSKKSLNNDSKGYLLITHEDNVRGLHLDSLDGVVVVGRPGSPDEYTHIAGRTGRAGRRGSVLNVVSFEQAAALTTWHKMLGVDFIPLDESEISGILDN